MSKIEEMEVDGETSDSKSSSELNFEGKDVEQSKGKVMSVVNELKSESASAVYKAMHYVRVKVLERPKGPVYFYECGGTVALYRIISTSDCNLLNVAVSILGNLCTVLISNEGFCDEVSVTIFFSISYCYNLVLISSKSNLRVGIYSF